MYLKFKFSRNLNSRGHGVRTEHCWRAGPSGQDTPCPDKLLLFASIYRQARWHARLSWTAPAKHRLVASLYFAFPALCEHGHPHFSTVIATHYFVTRWNLEEQGGIRCLHNSCRNEPPGKPQVVSSIETRISIWRGIIRILLKQYT